MNPRRWREWNGYFLNEDRNELGLASGERHVVRQQHFQADGKVYESVSQFNREHSRYLWQPLCRTSVAAE